MNARRRRTLRPEPLDRRELVVIGDRVMTCDEFKVGAAIRMARFDQLAAPYRELCNEMNLHAGDVATLAQRGLSAAELRQKAERKLAVAAGGAAG